MRPLEAIRKRARWGAGALAFSPISRGHSPESEAETGDFLKTAFASPTWTAAAAGHCTQTT